MNFQIHATHPAAAMCCEPSHPEVRIEFEMTRPVDAALTPRDRFMLTVVHMSRVLEVHNLPRWCRPDAEALRTCYLMATILVAEQDQELAQAAWPADLPRAPGQTLEQALRRELVRWHQEFDELPRRLFSPGAEQMSPREILLAHHGLAIQSERIAPGQDLRAALVQATCSAAERSGTTIEDDECTDPAIAGTFRIALDNAGSICRLAYTDHDGRFRLGARDVRDALAPRKVLPTLSLDAPFGVHEDLSIEDMIPDPDGRSGQAQLEGREQFAALKAALEGYVERRLLELNPGTTLAIVLANLWALMTGELAIEALASTSGKNRKTLEAALTKERKRMQLDPIIKRLQQAA